MFIARSAPATPRSMQQQRGNAITLLLSVLVVGLLFYFMLKPHGGNSSSPVANALNPAAGASMATCEQQIAKLVQTTGGIGPDAQAAYAKLPAQCQKLMPNPANLAPPDDSMGEPAAKDAQ